MEQPVQSWGKGEGETVPIWLIGIGTSARDEVAASSARELPSACPPPAKSVKHSRFEEAWKCLLSDGYNDERRRRTFPQALALGIEIVTPGKEGGEIAATDGGVAKCSSCVATEPIPWRVSTQEYDAWCAMQRQPFFASQLANAWKPITQRCVHSKYGGWKQREGMDVALGYENDRTCDRVSVNCKILISFTPKDLSLPRSLQTFIKHLLYHVIPTDFQFRTKVLNTSTKRSTPHAPKGPKGVAQEARIVTANGMSLGAAGYEGCQMDFVRYRLGIRDLRDDNEPVDVRRDDMKPVDSDKNNIRTLEVQTPEP
ncbi:hypothetical protein WN55_03760 [Dufourea novaeangliae]|uniref:Uncharacterized protein n=1 Tax=Dufourea novaeangliae TaxID=178035 RepID=A0A154PK66_DUFNO|nr:hypothetical protein WN55_03760 [Dufourea novaeangliae]